MASQSEPFAEQGRMIRTTTSNAGQPSRPWLVWVAHRWYSWSVLAATVAGTYLAANGDLRLGNGSQLRAASPEVSWKPTSPPVNPTLPEAPKAPVAPITDDDPFKAASQPVKPPAEVVPAPQVKMASEGPALPDPFKATPDAKPALDKKVGDILNAYVNDKEVVPVKTEDIKPLPKIELPKFVAPPLPPRVTETPMAGPELPSQGKSDAGPGLLPALPGGEIPAGSGGVKVPAIPPAPGPMLPVVNEVPMIPGTVLVQQPENLNVQPKPVEKPAVAPAEKKEPEVKKRRIIGRLSQDDEIKLNAAQNASRLGEYNRAAALMADVIGRNPDEYDLRAEYAGILLAAGDAKGAIRELDRVIKLAPNVAGYRLLLGDAFMGARNFRAAAEVFTSALEMISQDPRLADRAPEIVIRTARAYALDQDFFRAAHLVDKYLANIKPDDPRAPLAMGAMLLDLDRPYDALPYLIEKRKQLLASPEGNEDYELKVLEILASMVRGFARIGDRQQAMDAIQELSQKAPKQIAIRVTLADILFEMGEHDLAGHVYNQVLAVDPANAAALLGIARVYLETFQTTAAKRVLDSFIPNASYQRSYLMTYSSYHQTIGEYTEAKQIYRDMLRRNDNDHEVRYALGRLYEYTKEWEKAKGEFAKIPPYDKMARRARLWFGYALLHQRKYAEAAQVAEQFMRDDPNNPEGVALHVRAVAKLGQFDRAVQAGRGYLALNTRDERSATTVRLAVARALLEANRNMDAAREYEIALSKPAGRVPEAYYGLSRAAEKLGNAERAQQIIGTLCGAVGTDVRNRLLLADYYSEDYEDQKVIEIINSFAGYDNNNLALLVRLADAQQRSARWPGTPGDCFATCQQIIRQSPTNVRGHLSMARAFATTQNYRKASVQYDQLITIDPEFTIPPRERARILYSDKQFSAARSQYNVVLSPTPEEHVLGQMAYHSQRDARLKQAFGPYLGGHMNGPALRAELARLASSCPDEEARLAAHRLICDYDATLAWQEPFRLERDGKELKGYRDYMAIPQYNAANQFEPTNTETLFDEGQTYAALKMTRAALTWYANTLAVDPTHRDAAVASERASANISPRLDIWGDLFSQRGRTGVASIDRQRYTAAVALPIGDENEYVQFGYQRIFLEPTDDKGTIGTAPFFRVQKKWDDNRMMTYAQVNLEQYQDWISTRPTFDAGYWYDHSDVFRTRGGAYLENVLESGESLRQDIYRYGVYSGLDVKPTRTWQFGGTATYAHYSDDNDACMGFLYNEVSLSLPPKQLKLVQRASIWSYRETTQFPTDPPDPNNLVGAVHPYFSPDIFSSLECRIEWWHWLSRDYFAHSNQCYYSVQYGIATDNNLITYHNAKVLFNYDCNSYLTIGAEGSAILSSEYDMYQAMAFIQIRFLGP